MTGALQGGADETDAHQGGAAPGQGARQGGADETDRATRAEQTIDRGALQGRSRRDRRPPGRSTTRQTAHQGGADETDAHQGGAEIPDRDWDLEETESTRGRESTFGFRNRGREFKSGHGRSGASGSHDGSGDLMGHGGSGVLREQWRGAPSMKVLGELHYLEGALWKR